MYNWYQTYTPVPLGKVFVIENGNHTMLSTSTDTAALASNTQFKVVNGTIEYAAVFRTDVNSAGTVTAAAPTGMNQNIAL